MYNGIGLDTARGSGTNGYVTRNLSALRKLPDKQDYKSEEELQKLEAQFNKKPNKGILEHDRKRQVEVKCIEMTELMEDQGFTDLEIEAKVSVFRKLLMEKEAVSDNITVLKDDFGRPIGTETHQIALATEEKNARWREAFGIQPRDDEKKAFGEEMEKRWEKEEEREEEIRIRDHRDDGKKKKKKRRDHSEEKQEKRPKQHKKNNSEEREIKKSKHRRDDSEEREVKKSKHRRDDSEERDKRQNRDDSEERTEKRKSNRRDHSPEEKKKHRKPRRSPSPSPVKKDRRRESRSRSRSPRKRRDEESPKRSRRHSSSSPEIRSRKKR